MKYTVVRIDEDIDFGCEERSDTDSIMAVVTLRDKAGNELTGKFKDADLYSRDINVGDTVIIDESGDIQKALDEDWTKTCNTSNVDIPQFVSMMQQVKSGQEVDWICPFCGGQSGLLEQQEHHTVIGCHSCDMRITLDN